MKKLTLILVMLSLVGVGSVFAKTNNSLKDRSPDACFKNSNTTYNYGCCVATCATSADDTGNVYYPVVIGSPCFGTINSGRVELHIGHWDNEAFAWQDPIILQGSVSTFGSSVAVTSNPTIGTCGFSVIVGSPGNNCAYVYNYAYNASTKSFNQISIESIDSPTGSSDFGSSVTISGNTAAIAAQGKVYLYDIGQTPPKLTSKTSTSYPNNKVAISSSNNLLLIYSYNEKAGEIYIYNSLSFTTPPAYDTKTIGTTDNPSVSIGSNPEAESYYTCAIVSTGGNNPTIYYVEASQDESNSSWSWTPEQYPYNQNTVAIATDGYDLVEGTSDYNAYYGSGYDMDILTGGDTDVCNSFGKAVALSIVPNMVVVVAAPQIQNDNKVGAVYVYYYGP